MWQWQYVTELRLECSREETHAIDGDVMKDSKTGSVQLLIRQHIRSLLNWRDEGTAQGPLCNVVSDFSLSYPR